MNDIIAYIEDNIFELKIKGFVILERRIDDIITQEVAQVLVDRINNNSFDEHQYRDIQLFTVDLINTYKKGE